MRSKHLSLHLAIIASLLFGGASIAQDVPGLSIGGFYELRTDNRIGGEDLSFSYVGARIQVRDERLFEGFVDVGREELELGDFDEDDAGCFGLGGTFWLSRAEDGFFGVDLGVYGSYHTADYTLSGGSIDAVDARYSRYLAQAVIRGETMSGILPYLRVGVMGSELDVDETAINSDDKDVTNPAVNVGLQFELSSPLTLTVEGNYSDNVGGSVRLDYWF